MRRLFPAASLLALSAVLIGCEDGPNQTYTPLGPGAGDLINNGDNPGSVDPTKGGFVDPAQAGTNKQVLCDGPTKQKTWAAAFHKPVLPPRSAAGLDLAGGETWQGLTIEDAEDPKKGGLCQSDSFGDLRGDGTLFNGWGDNGEIYVNYRAQNHKIISFLLFPGYLGTIDLIARKGGRWDGHNYQIPVGTQVQKDNTNWTLNWATDRNFLPEADELYDAMIATFAPAFPEDQDCQASRRCIVGSFGDVAYFFIPALGSAIWIPNRSAAQPAPSILFRIDQDLAKVMSYSFADPLIKLDAEGPIGIAGTLGAATTPCTLKMGVNFGDFKSQCVQVQGDVQKDKTELNKLLGGLTHNTERFHFDVQGLDLNFSDKTLAPDAVVQDTDLPTDDDTATQFSIDQSTLGRIANDRVGNVPSAARDNHGAGLVYLEYARLVQDHLSKFLQSQGAPARALGDAACLAPNVSPTNPVYPAGCTGFEGIVTHVSAAAAPSYTHNALGYDASKKINSGYDGGLKPGHLQVSFCLDANGDPSTGYKQCNSPPSGQMNVGASGDIFSTSFARVLAVSGKGLVQNLPNDVQDVRFFFREFVIALLGYMQSVGVNETVDGVHAAVGALDPDNLFFDSIGAGQFELGEFIDRRFASKTVDPTDVTIEADVKNGIFDGFFFSRDIFRGEGALYQSMLEDQNHGIGQENTALLTNMFGSKILKDNWVDIPDPNNPGGPPLKTAYYCATTKDPANCTITPSGGGTPTTYLPPLDAAGNIIKDEAGNPLLAPYKGALGTARTSWTLGSTTVKVIQQRPEIQSAKIEIQLHSNPYDLTSDPPAGQAALQVLVPWLPKQPGVGFPVALTGTRDKFIETYQLDMSGTTITANVDYDIKLDNNGNPVKTGDIEFKAVETTDFLGNVFLCRDDVTKDILSVEMYTPVAVVLDWFSSHPGTYQSCGIIIRYSPYGNYADYITSLTNGVRLGITQGGGFGRVVDVTLFTPGQ